MNSVTNLINGVQARLLGAADLPLGTAGSSANVWFDAQSEGAKRLGGVCNPQVTAEKWNAV